ncbi:MAG: CBU_0592 family membrane protein [Rickettsiales bacterium]
MVTAMIAVFGHVVGFIGMACVVFAFYMTVEGTWSSQGLRYNQVNLGGAVLLLISLLIHFNLGSFIIELFWIAISSRGIWRKHQQMKSYTKLTAS